MRTYVCTSVADFYKQIYGDMITAPTINPRGQKTKEIIAPQILLLNPRNRLALNKDRRFSTKYAIVESLMLFSKTKELKYFEAFNKNIRQFSDDGETLSGSYGYRIAENIPKLVEKLKSDNSTRQAVLPILGKDDVFKDTKDTPCTLNIQLLIRNNELNAIVNMRSNDIIWGLPYDIFMFTTFQEIIANSLGLKIGWYLHRPASLHLYEHHYELFENTANNFNNKTIKWRFNYKQWQKFATLYKSLVDCKAENTIVEELYKIATKSGDANV